MSYILDALQRAEAERERGQVPGLKSQMVPPAGRQRAVRSALRFGRPSRPLLTTLWMAMAAVVTLSGGWWMTSDRGLSVDMAPVAATEAPMSLPALPAPPAPLVAPAPPAPPSPAGSARPQPMADPEPVRPILAPPRPAPAASVALVAPVAPVAPAPSAKGSPESAAPAKTTPALQAVPGFGELSADARAQLPAVSISGSTFSQNPALRMLIANGKVVQEGQDIAAGLRLETIGPRSAVLNHQGMRYSIGY